MIIVVQGLLFTPPAHSGQLVGLQGDHAPTRKKGNVGELSVEEFRSLLRVVTLILLECSVVSAVRPC